MSGDDFLGRLSATLNQRRDADPERSYVASLQRDGLDATLRKLNEESLETVLAARDAEHSGQNGDLVHGDRRLVVPQPGAAVPFRRRRRGRARRAASAGRHQRACGESAAQRLTAPAQRKPGSGTTQSMQTSGFSQRARPRRTPVPDSRATRARAAAITINPHTLRF